MTPTPPAAASPPPPPRAKRSGYGWLLTAARYGLIVAAAIFLYRAVPWYDHVHLNDESRTLVRLIRQESGAFVVWEDGREVAKTPAEIHFAQVGDSLLPDIELGIRNVVVKADHVVMLWSVLLFFPVPLMSAVRLIWMLAIQRVRLSPWNSVKLTFAGNFFNFALPGTTGGDLIKAYYITRFTDRKTEAVTTVFLDRAIGLLALVLMAAAMIVFTRDPSQFRQLGVTLGLLCGGLAVGAVVVFSARVRRVLRLREIAARLPMHEQILRVADATLAMRRHKLLVMLSLLITFGLQGICMISAAVMAKALGMPDDFMYVFIYVSIGFLIAAIPTTPQAFGVMESFYVLVFTYQGQSAPSQALALALAVRLIQLVWSLPGVLVPLLGAHRPSRAEIEEMERAREGPGNAAAGAAQSVVAARSGGVDS